jgi:hypothetical protein
VAVAVHITAQNMTKEDYERVRKELHAPDGGHPQGRLYHAAYGADELQMFEVWDSRERADAHYRELSGTALGGPISVRVEPLYSTRPD